MPAAPLLKSAHYMHALLLPATLPPMPTTCMACYCLPPYRLSPLHYALLLPATLPHKPSAS